MIRIKLNKHFFAVLFAMTINVLAIAQYNVVWSDAVGVTIDNGTTDASGNIITYSTVTKTAADGWDNAGSTSENFLPASGNNFIEYTITQSAKQYSFGLSSATSGGNPLLIDYAFNFQSNNKFNISENGVAKTALVSFNVGDKFQIQRTGEAVHYKRYNVLTGNWTKILNSNQHTSSNLKMDVTIFTSGFVLSGIFSSKRKILQAKAGLDQAKCLGTTPIIHIGGTPASMGGVPPVTFSWTPTTGLSSSTISMPIANPTVTTTYTLTATDNAGNVSTDNVIVTIYSLPTIAIAAEYSIICAGGSSILTASGALTYTWLPATGLSSTTGSTVTASPTTTTTYTVTGTNSNGCKNTAVRTITVNSGAVVSVTPATSTVCQGVSTTLTATGASSYLWSPTTGLSSSTGSSVTATPTSTTTYTVTGTTLTGCAGTSTSTITVNPTPTVAASVPSAVVCLGNTINILASVATTYSWSPSTFLNTTVGASVISTPTSNVTYTVTGTNSFGCTNTATSVITSSPYPTVTVSPNVAICLGGSTNLVAAGALTYSWSPGTGLSSTIGAGVIASPVTATGYTVTGTNAGGCTNTAVVFVLIGSGPVVSVSPPTSTICQGVSTTLTVAGASTYSWSPTLGLSSSTGTSVTATPNATITYTVTGTSASGCTGTSTTTINVNQKPIVRVSIGTVRVCSGDNYSITATGASTYSWSPSTYLNTTAGANVIATPTSNITYTVTGTDANGCTNTATTTIIISPNPIVTVSPNVTICIGQSTTLIAAGAFNYAWLPATGLSSTIGSSVIATPTVTTTYTVTGTNASKCTGTAVITVTVNPLPVVSVVPVTSTINLGNVITLTASGATTYSWSPATGLDLTSGSMVHAGPVMNTTYTVTGTNASGCSATATSTINLNPLGIDCNDCLPSFTPYPSRKYVLSAWAKQAGAAPTITSYTAPKITVSTTLGALAVSFSPSGSIIDGWQKIEGEFTLPGAATDIKIKLESIAGDVYFDDIRVFPYDGSMKSYVYDPINMRLVAELDERNFATLYEYDEEGKLVRVKKETERGIMTIKENRNNTSK